MFNVSNTILLENIALRRGRRNQFKGWKPSQLIDLIYEQNPGLQRGRDDRESAQIIVDALGEPFLRTKRIADQLKIPIAFE